MQSKTQTIEQYLKELPADRQEPMNKLHKLILKNLPKGFKECMAYGMIGYVVPLSLYPQGYHCDPKLPLGFMCLASQKNYISIHHMGIYGDDNLTKWFTKEYEKLNLGKLDMGKGCIRFKKTENIPYKLIEELAGKVTVQQWIDSYEKMLTASKARTKK